MVVLYHLSSFLYLVPGSFYLAGQEMHQLFRTEIQSIGISDSTAWSTVTQMTPSNY